MATTYTSGLEAIDELVSQFDGVLSTTYVATFASFGGAEAKSEDKEPTAAEQVGKVLALFKLSADRESEFSAPARPRNDVDVNIRVIATDFNGAVIGTANPTGSDTLLSRTLTAWINANRSTLERNYGLLGIRVRGNEEGIEQSSEGPVKHINPHVVTFTYLRS